MNMHIHDTPMTACKVGSLAEVDLSRQLTFVAVAPGEISLICPVDAVPSQTRAREDGWRVLQVEGPLDFSLVGILARISAVLAEVGVSIFALSTYDTDYILVKESSLEATAEALTNAGFVLD